ncbi:hypothetical protein GN958_ATG22259 [Phytophthora infestans]|uniref:Uncharacterized protein n=1 Tax=Phytophthora infestans TaxID=4787 RepID=A0A8S9TJH7_PHYIN|nr:hypothetical protein GN958_ATG22259 [Phytophthora infestans]
MDPVLWSEASSIESGEDSQQSSSEATEAPSTKKARLASDQVNVRASRTSIPTKKKAVSKKKTAHKKTKKAAPKKSAPAKETSAPKKSKTPAPPMRWTVALTALAIETRYKTRWEATVHTFLEQALIDNAWGDAEQPRDVSVDQFKNKLNAVRTAYRAKRTQLLATGNKALEDTSGSEDDEEERQYAEMPRNFFLHSSENIDGNLTYDPMDVNPKYRVALGKELTALWPLLCDVFSGNPGCTGEPIIESGVSRDRLTEDVDDEHSVYVNGDGSDEACSDISLDARNEAKANAKARYQSAKPSSNRPVDVIAGSLEAGFGSIERILTARQSTRSGDPFGGGA